MSVPWKRTNIKIVLLQKAKYLVLQIRGERTGPLDVSETPYNMDNKLFYLLKELPKENRKYFIGF